MKAYLSQITINLMNKLQENIKIECNQYVYQKANDL